MSQPDPDPAQSARIHDPLAAPASAAPTIGRRAALALATGAIATSTLLGHGAPARADTGSARGRFVTREGTRLVLDGQTFDFGGANMYWLGLDENVGGVDYPTTFRIWDGLRAAQAMNVTVVRAHTLGISVGNAKSVEPALDQFNPQAFDTIDYAIATAGAMGIRLVIPLIDEWNYYSGGRDTFTSWLGLADRNAFYTDSPAIAAFQRYLATLLGHVNRYTGRCYPNDPTVLAWELGNELNDMPASWIHTISAYLHRLAPHQLIAAGQQSGINPATLTAAQVDIVDCHYYPPTVDAVTADAARVTAAGKVYLAGEYASTAASTSLLRPLAGDHAITGMAFWSLFPHADDHGYVEHDDGFTLHYPGDTDAAHAEVAAISGYGTAVTPRRRLRTPAACPPVITSIDKRAGLNRIGWRGDVTAHGYQVQRADRTGRWRVVGGSSDPLTDTDAPWMDLSTPTEAVRYRVISLDSSGQPLCASTAVSIGPNSDVLVDLLESWRTVSSHTATLSVRPVQGRVQVAPAPGAPGAIGWHGADLSSIAVELPRPAPPAGSPAPAGLPRVEYAAADGSWQLAATHQRRDGNAVTLVAGLPTGTADVRLKWLATPAPAAVTGVTLTGATASPATAPPGPFDITRPAAGTGTPVTTPITWTAADQAAYYSLVVSTNHDLSDPALARTGLTTTAFVPADVFEPTTTYYLRVQAHNQLGTRTAAESPLRFTTGAAPTGVPIDDFERYLSDADLSAAYKRNTGGDPITTTLASDADGTGQGMRLTATLGGAGYAGVEHTLPTPGDWRGMAGIAFWLRPEQTASADWSLSFQFQAGGLYWQADLHPTGTQARTVQIPFADFSNPPWATKGSLDLSNATAIAVYVGGSAGDYTCVLDSIRAMANA